jgi:hypothetical protein
MTSKLKILLSLHNRRVLLYIVIGILFVLLSNKITNQIDYPNTDFFSYWLGATMVVDGDNPFNEVLWIENHHTYGATWISDRAYLYPLPLSILTAPLGLFPLKQAFTIWSFLTMVMLFLSMIISFKLWKIIDPKPYIFPILAGIVLFRPTILTLTGGQFGGALLLILCISVYLFTIEKWFLGGVLLALVALKPNTGSLIILLSVFWLTINRKWLALGGVIISGIALFMIGWVYDHNWVSSYLFIGNRKVAETFGFSPTVWGTASGICGFKLDCVLGLGGILVSLFLCISIFLLVHGRQRLSPSLALSLIISTVLLVTPYIWTYDHVLLILPLMVIIAVLAQNSVRFIATGSLFLIIDLVAMAFLLITINIEKEIYNSVIPLICFGLIGWAIYLFLKAGKNAERSESETDTN